MNRIFKFLLEITDQQSIALPVDAKPLAVQFQRGVLCLWALFDDQAPLVPHTIQIFGTGNPMPKEVGNYVGTVQESSHHLVWHVFHQPPA